jgi:hypothetical protein
MVMVETLAVTGPQAVVRVAGHTFNAQGELPPGPANFWALVEAVMGETLHLRRLPGDMMAEHSPEEVARLLQLPTDKDTVKLLGEMLKRGLPLDRQAILKLLAEGQALPEHERESFWAARLYLESLDIREKIDQLRSAADYLLRRDPALRDLTAGQEALNRAQVIIPGQMLLRFLTFGGEAVFGELYLVYEGTGGTAPETPSALVVEVISPLLDRTWVYLGDGPQGMVLKVAVSQERFYRQAADDAEALRLKLAAAGYEVNEVEVVLNRIEDIFAMLEPSSVPEYRSLDTIV